MNQASPPMDPAVAPTYVYTWQVIIGQMRIFIAGPGDKSWFPVTAPDSSPGNPGTPDDLRIAHAAVSILAKRHMGDREAGPNEIRQALTECGWIADSLTSYPKAS